MIRLKSLIIYRTPVICFTKPQKKMSKKVDHFWWTKYTGDKRFLPKNDEFNDGMKNYHYKGLCIKTVTKWPENTCKQLIENS